MDSFEGIRICFLADKHDLYDDRIYWKMAVPMRKRGAEVHYCLIGPEEEAGTTAEGIRFRILKVKTYSGNPYVNFLLKRLNPNNNYKRLYRISAELEADIYHFHDLWLNRISPRLKILPHRPVVFYDAREPYAEDYRNHFGSGRLSQTLIDKFASWVDRWEKKSSENYDLVIANEHKVRDQFSEVIGENKAVALYNYPDLHFFNSHLKKAEKQKPKEKPFDLFYCGLLTENRGAWNVLMAARILKKRIPKLKVLLLGRVDPPELKDQMFDYIHKHQLEKTVIIKAQVPYEEVGAYFAASKVGLLLWNPMSNLRIKMPIKIFEYMAFGLPVVGSNFGHIAEVISRKNCGIAVDAENVEEVAGAVESLLGQDQSYSIYRENGIEVSRKEYNWEAELERLCNFYNRALNER